MMKKIAHYRRVVWHSDEPRTLGETLRDCFASLDESEGVPSFKLPEGEECSVARRAATTEPVFLHLVKYVLGAPAAVIKAAMTTPVVETSTTDAPADAEFIQSQLFCLVDGNDAVWMSHNAPLREGSIKSLLVALVKSRIDDDDSAAKFTLIPKLDRKSFSDVFEEGIAEINLGVGVFKSTLEFMTSGGSKKWPEQLGSIIKERPSADEMEASSNVDVNLALRPGRNWSNPYVKTLMAHMADKVFDQHEAEFTIKTKNGIRLTHEKMTVHKECKVEGSKQILEAASAKQELQNVLVSLQESGILED